MAAGLVNTPITTRVWVATTRDGTERGAGGIGHRPLSREFAQDP
ncbi:hypothetical protein HMPREF3223_00492 [Cutibacterium avidum]|nr:hypothetical protein HMPREF3223_00492 [Cutibacterium avidum]